MESQFAKSSKMGIAREARNVAIGTLTKTKSAANALLAVVVAAAALHRHLACVPSALILDHQQVVITIKLAHLNIKDYNNLANKPAQKRYANFFKICSKKLKIKLI